MELARRGITSAELARLVEASPSFVSRVLSGERRLSLEEGRRWASQLGWERGTKRWWTWMDAVALSHVPEEWQPRFQAIIDAEQRCKELELQMARMAGEVREAFRDYDSREDTDA